MTQANKVIIMQVPANLVAERQAAAARLAEYRRHEVERITAAAPLTASPEGVRSTRGILIGLIVSAGIAFVVWFSIWGWRLL